MVHVTITPPTPPPAPEDILNLRRYSTSSQSESGPQDSTILAKQFVEQTISNNATFIPQQSSTAACKQGLSADAPNGLPGFKHEALVAALSRLQTAETSSSPPVQAKNSLPDVVSMQRRIAVDRSSESKAITSKTTENHAIAVPLLGEAAVVNVLGKWKSITLLTPDPVVASVEDKKKPQSFASKFLDHLPFKKGKTPNLHVARSKSPAAFRGKFSSGPSDPVLRNYRHINDAPASQLTSAATCFASGLILSENHLIGMDNPADLEILCGNTIFPVHKSVVKKCSPAFAALLKDNSEVSCRRRAKYEDIGPDVMKHVLNFMYFGKHSIPLKALDETSASKLLLVADRFGLPDLGLLVQGVLCARLTVNNVCSILELAHRCSAKQLKEQAILFILGSWHEVLSSQEWLTLTSTFPALAEGDEARAEDLIAEMIQILLAVMVKPDCA